MPSPRVVLDELVAEGDLLEVFGLVLDAGLHLGDVGLGQGAQPLTQALFLRLLGHALLQRLQLGELGSDARIAISRLEQAAPPNTKAPTTS